MPIDTCNLRRAFCWGTQPVDEVVDLSLHHCTAVAAGGVPSQKAGQMNAQQRCRKRPCVCYIEASDRCNGEHQLWRTAIFCIAACPLVAVNSEVPSRTSQGGGNPGAEAVAMHQIIVVLTATRCIRMILAFRCCRRGSTGRLLWVVGSAPLLILRYSVSVQPYNCMSTLVL